tara:strand:+ start:70 stop:627 length:558 start_codon:yes stop_codon:yes gene_type:complete
MQLSIFIEDKKVEEPIKVEDYEGSLYTRWISRDKCKEFINLHHRHIKAPQGDIFRIALYTEDDVMVGAIMVGRPVSREYDPGTVCEVNRLCVLPGIYNGCSLLYAKAARIAREWGFERIITYTLQEETGSSLRASGWVESGTVRSRVTGWHSPARKREQNTRTKAKIRWEKIFKKKLYSSVKKKR